MQNSDRISRLKDKIDGIETSIEKEKVKQLERINSHLEAIDEKLKHTIEGRNYTIDSMSGEVNLSYQRK